MSPVTAAERAKQLDCEHQRTNANGCTDCLAPWCSVCSRCHPGDGWRSNGWERPDPWACVRRLQAAAARLVDVLGCLPYATAAGPEDQGLVERVAEAEASLRDLVARVPRTAEIRSTDQPSDNGQKETK